MAKKDKSELDHVLMCSATRPLTKEFGTPKWHARDIEENGFFGDVGEIEHVIYKVRRFADQIGTGIEWDRGGDGGTLSFLFNRLSAACNRRNEEHRTSAGEIVLYTMKNACEQAAKLIVRRKTPEEWSPETISELRALLMEIHACQGDLLRYDRAIRTDGSSRGGRGKTTVATEMLQGMRDALQRKYGRPVTAKELREEGKKQGWIEERGKRLLLKHAQAQTTIPNDLKFIG